MDNGIRKVILSKVVQIFLLMDSYIPNVPIAIVDLTVNSIESRKNMITSEEEERAFCGWLQE